MILEFQFPQASSINAILLRKTYNVIVTHLLMWVFLIQQGVQAAYVGPLASLENRDYSHEGWYTTSKAAKRTIYYY